MTAIDASHRRSESGQSASVSTASNLDRSGKTKSFSRGSPESGARADGHYPSSFQPSRNWQSQPQQYQQYQQPRNYQPQYGQQQYGSPGNNLQHIAQNSVSNQPPVYATYGLSPAMAHMWHQQPEHRSLTEVSAGVIDFLGQRGISARLGGSLAARANGGIRKPGDVDFEVASTSDFEKAHRMLSNVDTMVTMPDGVQVRMQGYPQSYTPGRSGIVNLTMTYPNGERREIEADVVNENCYGLDPHILSPHQRQTNPGNASGNVHPQELVVNCLSRHIFKPTLSAKKDDVYTIAALLRHAGFNAHDPNMTAAIVSEIAGQFQPQYRAIAHQKFSEIVGWMANGQL